MTRNLRLKKFTSATALVLATVFATMISAVAMVTMPSPEHQLLLQSALAAREMQSQAINVRSRVPVAVIGNTSSEIDISAAVAVHAHLLPRYVNVITSSSRYAFSPFAQIVRTTKSVVVNAFNLMYVFPVDSVRVYYSGSDNDVPVAALPFGAFVEPREPTLTLAMRGMRSQKAMVCPDCSALATGSRRIARLQQHWEGLKDPWQRSMVFMKVFNGSSVRNVANPKRPEVPGGSAPSNNWPSLPSVGSIGFSNGGGGNGGRPRIVTYVTLCAGRVGASAGYNYPSVAHTYMSSVTYAFPSNITAWSTSYDQAGPVPNNIITGFLKRTTAYTQSPGALNCIIVDENPGAQNAEGTAVYTYGLQPAAVIPHYNVLNRNCNTWTDAIVLSLGFPQDDVEFDFYELKRWTGLFALGYSYGPAIEPLFIQKL